MGSEFALHQRRPVIGFYRCEYPVPVESIVFVGNRKKLNETELLKHPLRSPVGCHGNRAAKALGGTVFHANAHKILRDPLSAMGPLDRQYGQVEALARLRSLRRAIPILEPVDQTADGCETRLRHLDAFRQSRGEIGRQHDANDRAGFGVAGANAQIAEGGFGS